MYILYRTSIENSKPRKMEKTVLLLTKKLSIVSVKIQWAAFNIPVKIYHAFLNKKLGD
jgi:hypothetical protein